MMVLRDDEIEDLIWFCHIHYYRRSALEIPGICLVQYTS